MARCRIRSRHRKEPLFFQEALRGVLLCVLPSLPFLVARYLCALKTGQLNIDFLLPYLVYLVAGRIAGAAVFVIVCASEVAAIIGRVYFFSLTDLFFASAFLKQVQTRLLILSTITVVAVIATLTWLWLRFLPDRKTGRRFYLAVWPLAFFALLLGLDTARGFNPATRGREAHVGTHAVEESLRWVVGSIWDQIERGGQKVIHVPAATDEIREELLAGVPLTTDFVVVVVESMGVPKDPSSAREEFSVFDGQSIRSRYSVREGVVPFNGATESGEIREICGLRVGLQTKAAIRAANGCLPDQLAARGYATESLHGFKAEMYHRRVWEPEIGFQHSYFLEDMQSLPGYDICPGAFPGICDGDIARRIREELEALNGGGRHTYIHWMTLNSHLPVQEAGAPPGPCFPGYPTDVCVQLRYVEAVLRDVKAIADDRHIPPTTFIIVGDHAPPYFNRQKRELFSLDTVPFIVLKPKTPAAI